MEKEHRYRTTALATLSLLVVFFIATYNVNALTSVEFVSPPTPGNGTFTSNTFVQINASINGTLGNLTWNWNGTSYPIFDNSTLVMYGFENNALLGENSTFVADLSGHGRDAIPLSGSVWTSSGKYGGAYSFDGVDDYIHRPGDDPSLNPSDHMTVSAWFKANEYGTNIYDGTILAKNDEDYGGVNGYVLNAGANSTRFCVGNGSGDGWQHCAGTPSTLVPGVWYHVVGTFNGTDVKIFLNGEEKGNKTFDSITIAASNRSLEIGRNPYSARYFNGSIDEVRIYNRSLSAAEAYILYSSDLQEYNSTKWYYYLNQSRNASTGLSDGAYTYQAFAYDSSGNSSQTDLRTLTVDTTAPTTSASAIRNGSASYVFDTWVNSQRVNVSLTCDDGSGTGCDKTLYCTDTVNSCTPNTTYSTTINVTTLDISYIRYQSNDSLGNTEPVKNRTIRIDWVAPTTSASANLSNASGYTFDTWTSSTYVNVTLSCADTISGCNTTLYCKDSSNACIPTLTYSAPVQVSTQGVSYIRYQSNDSAGRTDSVGSGGIRIDSTGPAIANATISSSTPAANTSIRLNATIVDAYSSVSTVKFDIEPFGNLTATANGNEYYLICSASNPCNTTQIGTYNWTGIWANDSLGNSASNVSVGLNYTVFPEPENSFSVNILSPPEGSSTSNLTPGFYYNVSGTNQTYTCSLYLNESLNATSMGVSNNTLAQINASWPSGQGRDGTWQWRINCSVNSLVSNVSGARNITFDTYPPEISGAHVNASSSYINGSINLNVSVTDALIGVSVVKFYVEPFGNLTATKISNNYYIICNATNPCNTTVPGTYNWTQIWANDSLGNSASNASVGLSYTVVAAAETGFSVNTITPVNEYNTSTTTPAFGFNVTGHSTAYICVVYVNGTAYGTNSTTINNTNTVIDANSSLSDGRYSWYVNCSNTTTWNMSTSRYITVDTTPPVTTATANKSDGSPYTFDSWTNSAYVNVSFLCSDGSGVGCVSFTRYCTDTDNSCTPQFFSPGLPPQISTEGVSYIRYWGNDTVGNGESVRNKTIRIDVTAPIISGAQIDGSTIYVNGSVRLNVSVADASTNVSVVRFYLAQFGNLTASSDGSSYYIICNSTNSCNTTLTGTYNWTQIWANDTVNNVRTNTSVSLSFTVVTTTTTTTTTTTQGGGGTTTPTTTTTTTSSSTTTTTSTTIPFTFTVSKTAQNTSYALGEKIQYLITVTNPGPYNMTLINLNDTFNQSQLRYNASNPVPNYNGSVLLYWTNLTGGVLSPNQSTIIRLNMTAVGGGNATNNILATATNSNGTSAGASASFTVNIRTGTTTTSTSTTTTTASSTTSTTPQAPLLYDVEAVSITETSAVIRWRSSLNSSGIVEYGLNASYGTTAYNSSVTQNHSVLLTGLAENTLYHYEARSPVNANLTGISGDYSFRTLYVYVSNESNMTANQTTTITVPQANLTLDIMTDENVENASVTVSSTTSSPVSEALGVPALNKYLRIEPNEAMNESLKSIMLKFYYTDEEVAAAGLNESSLSIYWFNNSNKDWVKLTTAMDWVYGTGVHTRLNYVWANVSHFSYYSVGGEGVSCALKGDQAPCNTVGIGEILDLITQWANGNATVNDVLALIVAWAQGGH